MTQLSGDLDSRTDRRRRRQRDRALPRRVVDGVGPASVHIAREPTVPVVGRGLAPIGDVDRLGDNRRPLVEREVEREDASRAIAFAQVDGRALGPRDADDLRAVNADNVLNALVEIRDGHVEPREDERRQEEPLDGSVHRGEDGLTRGPSLQNDLDLDIEEDHVAVDHLGNGRDSPLAVQELLDGGLEWLGRCRGHAGLVAPPDRHAHRVQLRGPLLEEGVRVSRSTEQWVDEGRRECRPVALSHGAVVRLGHTGGEEPRRFHRLRRVSSARALEVPHAYHRPCAVGEEPTDVRVDGIGRDVPADSPADPVRHLDGRPVGRDHTKQPVPKGNGRTVFGVEEDRVALLGARDEVLDVDGVADARSGAVSRKPERDTCRAVDVLRDHVLARGASERRDLRPPLGVRDRRPGRDHEDDHPVLVVDPEDRVE